MNVEKNVSLSPPPKVGQIVQVRTRKFLVDRVEPARETLKLWTKFAVNPADFQGKDLD